ncbi:Ig-like domain-containing protein [Patescibacteria group bacterium]|nr:Ig-like domain-containing protein [Patescibacteria group bacterium]
MYQTRTAAFPDCSPLTQCAATASCASSCTISLTPNPMTAFYGQNSILTATVNPVHATVSKVDFSSNNPTIASVDPASDGDEPYRTYVNGVQMGTTTITAVATLSPEGSCTANVPVTVESAAWFQTQGGDVHAQGSLTDKIPATALDPNLSLDLNNYSGVITHQSFGGVNLGEGYSSHNEANRWLAESSYQGKPYGSFDFFKKKYALQMTQDNFNGSLPAQDGIYYSNGSETLNGNQGDWDLTGNHWLVILVEGDVNIPFNVVMGQGSFLAIASSGKITFGNNVRKAQGMFVANGTIETGSSDRAFEGQGIFAANTFDLNRDFADSRNRTTPAETFKARPDFIMGSYKNKDENLWWFFQKWQELAP